MSLINELSALTTISLPTLEKFFQKEQLCIQHKFFENEMSGEPLTSINLEFGTLQIYHAEDELKYKFIPSKAFEQSLIDIAVNHKSPLIEAVEDSLRDKMVNTYKDLF